MTKAGRGLIDHEDRALQTNPTVWTGEDLIVLDIETTVCDETRQAFKTKLKEPLRHSTLRLITAISALVCSPGDPWTFNLSSFIKDERRALEGLDTLLRQHPDAALVTFNGLRYDIPTIEMRALHHFLFSSYGLAQIQRRKHYDLYDMLGRQCSLASLQACLALPVDDDVFLERSQFPYEQRKCEIDVVSTFLAFIQVTAFRLTDKQLVTNSWQAIGRHFATNQTGRRHLASLVRAVHH